MRKLNLSLTHSGRRMPSLAFGCSRHTSIRRFSSNDSTGRGSLHQEGSVEAVDFSEEGFAQRAAAVLSEQAAKELFPLSEAQVSQYRRDGFLVLRNVFSPLAMDWYKDSLQQAASKRATPVPTSNEVLPVTTKTVTERQIIEKNKELPPEERDSRVPDHKPSPIMKETTLSMKPTKTQRKQQQLRMHMERLREKRRRTLGLTPKGQEVYQPNREAARESALKEAEEVEGSEQLKMKMREEAHGPLIEAFFESMDTGYVHLHVDEQLDKFIRHGVGMVLGRVAAELGGFLQTRLFDDKLTQRSVWSNAHAFFADMLSVNFTDLRGMAATMVLPPCSSNLQRNSTRMVIPGSHHVMSKVTKKGHDISIFRNMPPGWDVGEWIRYSTMPEALERLPVVPLELNPGDVMLSSLGLLWAWSPHLGMTREEPLFHIMYLMPDGATFNGSRHLWMSVHKHGPLFQYEAGQPLRDQKVFPLLYRAPELVM